MIGQMGECLIFPQGKAVCQMETAGRGGTATDSMKTGRQWTEGGLIGEKWQKRVKSEEGRKSF